MTLEELHSTLGPWKKALITFQDILSEDENAIVRDAAIKRFEYNFELAWKAVKRFAKLENIDVNSPRSAFKAALLCGWIADSDIWLDMIDDRNLTTHTHKEVTAEEVYARLPRYQKAMDKLFSVLDKL